MNLSLISIAYTASCLLERLEAGENEKSLIESKAEVGIGEDIEVVRTFGIRKALFKTGSVNQRSIPEWRTIPPLRTFAYIFRGHQGPELNSRSEAPGPNLLHRQRPFRFR